MRARRERQGISIPVGSVLACCRHNMMRNAAPIDSDGAFSPVSAKAMTTAIEFQTDKKPIRLHSSSLFRFNGTPWLSRWCVSRAMCTHAIHIIFILHLYGLMIRYLLCKCLHHASPEQCNVTLSLVDEVTRQVHHRSCVLRAHRFARQTAAAAWQHRRRRACDRRHRRCAALAPCRAAMRVRRHFLILQPSVLCHNRGGRFMPTRTRTIHLSAITLN